MNRRSLGRGRLLVGLGSIVLLAGTALPWWTLGGTVTQQATGNAFEGVGIVVFVCAMALLALLVLPFASRAGESALDRPMSYGLVVLAAILVFGLRVYQIAQFGGLGLPDRAPGLWLCALGLLICAWGAAEMVSARS